jgi:hypothetical protein
MFFDTWTSELLITIRGFWTTRRDDSNVDSIGEEVKASTGSRLASRGLISFVTFFLARLSLHNGACYFVNSARVFALTRRTRFGGVSSEGASLIKRLDWWPPAMWNSFLTKLKFNQMWYSWVIVDYIKSLWLLNSQRRANRALA